MSVIVVRHGERQDVVDPNWAAKSQRPSDDPPLADKGRIQARETAARLATSESISHIFSSPFARAIETAHIIAEKLGKTINVEPGLGEVMWDFPPGYESTEKLRTQFPTIDTSYKPVLVPEHSESTDSDCMRRVGPVVQTIREKFTGNILFVGHGASCAGVVRAFLGGGPRYQGLCTISKLTRSSANQWKLTLDGCCDHLSDKTNLRPY